MDVNISLTGGYHLKRLNENTVLMSMLLIDYSFLIRLIEDEDEKSKHVLVFDGEEGKRQNLLGVIYQHHHYLSNDFVQSVEHSIEEFIPNQRCALAVSFGLDGLLNGNDFKEIRS